MKCNLEKINQFFESDKFNDDIKDMVLDLLKMYGSSVKDDEFINTKIVFLGLDFYEIEPDDEPGDEHVVIDFYKLNNLNIKLQKFIISIIIESFKNEGSFDFAWEFIQEDLKIVIPYKEWYKINRKNKLNELNNKIEI